MENVNDAKGKSTTFYTSSGQLRLPHPLVPPELTTTLLLNLTSLGISIDKAEHLIAEIIQYRISLYPNIDNNRFQQLQVYHFFEELHVQFQARNHQRVLTTNTNTSHINVAASANNPPPPLSANYDNAAQPQQAMMSTGLSRIPTIPYPPVPPELRSIYVLHQTTIQGVSVATAERLFEQKIQERMSLYPNIQHNILDQLKVYHFYEILQLYLQSYPSATGSQHEDISSECSICLVKHEDINIGRLDCGHSYHFDCINKWFKQTGSCPMCRRRTPTVFFWGQKQM